MTDKLLILMIIINSSTFDVNVTIARFHKYLRNTEKPQKKKNKKKTNIVLNNCYRVNFKRFDFKFKDLTSCVC